MSRQIVGKTVTPIYIYIYMAFECKDIEGMLKARACCRCWFCFGSCRFRLFQRYMQTVMDGFKPLKPYSTAFPV